MSNGTPPRKKRWPKVLAVVGAVVVAVLVVGVLILDRVLLSVAKKEAATLSVELGRPIAIDGVATQLWGGLGAKVSGLTIGAGPGESAPLLQLERAGVSVNAFRALRTGGREIEVREAVVRGLKVNVEKLADGTTNVDRLLARLKERSAKEEKPKAEPEAPGRQPGAPPALEVGRAALEDARIAFLDRTVKGAKELYVDHLDAEVKDLAVGKPLELVVKAAVLAPQQNLDFRVRAARLPPSLVPTPEQVTLKVQPIDLAPLAPFLPKGVGLRGGRFQADLQAALGAAVPGGEGPTKILGGFQATQLAVAGGGKPIDASLDADVTGDLRAGDLDLRKLELVVGPGALSGKGRASGLTGGSPRLEGLEITSRGLDPAALAEIYPPLRGMMGGAVVAGPVGLTIRGQGTAASQRIEVRADLGPVRLEVPRQLTKAAGAPLTLVATADADQGGGRVRFDTALDLGGVDLRPGGAVNKAPGDPLSVKLGGTYQSPAGGLQVQLAALSVNLLGDVLSGKGQVAITGAGKARTTRFDAEISGDRLDLDRLLLQQPAGKKKAAPPPAEKEPPRANAYAGLSGEARLRLGLLRVKGVDAREVLATVDVKDDVVTLKQAQLQALGGSVNAAGTLVRLAHPDEPFKLQTQVKGIQAEQAVALFSKQKVLSGALDADLTLTGDGMEKTSLVKALSGVLQGDLRGGVFHGKDLIAAVAAPLAGKLPFAKKVAEGGTTSLGKELPFHVVIQNGMATLQKPLQFDTGQGQVKLEGGIGLDGGLQLPTTVALAPEVIARLTGGRIKPDAPVPLQLRLGGTCTSPRVEGLNVDPAAKALAAQAATGALGKALGLGGGDAGGGKDEKGKEKGGKKSVGKQLDEAAKGLKGLFK
jgi:AsmA protein